MVAARRAGLATRLRRDGYARAGRGAHLRIKSLPSPGAYHRSPGV